ncbi:hypothetical protein BHU72_13175 [Desulfuribacillus stibiiarsenatis]|uniref:Uncharacterized protein n=1 Tax=Desulfuribacillus stibiiarsenatis TaxID=1390249 RepID=A0A1E5L8T3_9FIRM|nr:hypothetical protein BHU72_13175 [Desulfuribacillus stibiiarsenatis]
MPPGVLFAVYDNKTRQPEYIPPEYSDVPPLMEALVLWIHTEKELPIPIKEIAELFHVKPITITKWSISWLNRGII